MNDIVKTELPILGNSIIEFDRKNNQITIKNTSDKPLTVKFEGQLNLRLSDDFLLESDGEVDLITNGSMICLDSVESVIHLNSRKAKKLRTDNSNTDYAKILEEQKRLAKRNHQKHRCEGSQLENLRSLIDNINQRLHKLEKREEDIINVKSNGGCCDE